MAFTQYKKLSAQAFNTNNNTWAANGSAGVDLNTGVIGPIDYILAGVSTFSVASSNVTLTFTAGGGGSVSNCMWRFTGTLTASIVVSPAAGDATTYLNGFYYWENLTSGAFTITLTTGTGGVALPQARRGCVFIDGTNPPRIVSIAGAGTADPVPSGTSMLFKQASPPSGYTQVTSLNDYALRLVSGTGGGTGGLYGFTNVFTARTPTGTNSTSTAVIPRDGWGFSATVIDGRLVTTTNNAAFKQATADQTVTVGAQTFTGNALDFGVHYVDLINATRD